MKATATRVTRRHLLRARWCSCRRNFAGSGSEVRRSGVRLVKMPAAAPPAFTGGTDVVAGGTRATPEATQAFAVRYGGDGYIRLPGAGDVGLVVSRVVFGSPWEGSERSSRQRRLKAAVESGVNFIDLGAVPLADSAPLGHLPLKEDEEPWAARAVSNMVSDGSIRREELVLSATVRAPAGLPLEDALDVSNVSRGIDALFHFHQLPAIDLLSVEVPPPPQLPPLPASGTTADAAVAATAAAAIDAYRQRLLRALPPLLTHLKHAEIGGPSRLRVRLVGLSFPGGCPHAPYAFWASPAAQAASENARQTTAVTEKDPMVTCEALATSPLEDVLVCRDDAAAGLPLVLTFPVALSNGVRSRAVAAAMASRRPARPMQLAVGPSCGLVLVGSGLLMGRRPSGRPFRFADEGADAAKGLGTDGGSVSSVAADAQIGAGAGANERAEGGGGSSGGEIREVLADLKTTMSKVMHLEREFERRFGHLRAEGSEVEVPSKMDMSWGHVLAAQYDRLAGLDEWRVARAVKVEPTAAAALERLHEIPETRDWALLYRALLPPLLDAVSGSLRLAKERTLQAVKPEMDAMAPFLRTAAARQAAAHKAAGAAPAAGEGEVAGAAAGGEAYNSNDANDVASRDEEAADEAAVGGREGGREAVLDATTVAGRCVRAAISLGVDCVADEEVATTSGRLAAAAAAVEPLPPQQLRRLYTLFALPEK